MPVGHRLAVGTCLPVFFGLSPALDRMDGIPHEYLTRQLPGIGGELKERLEDFVVEEVPLYPPTGSGEHVLFEIEKRDLSTFEALERLSRALGRDTGDFGHAGLKDRKGITRQWLTVRGVDPAAVLALDVPQIAVLSAARHQNKLRTGHLRGNRFVIRVRGSTADEGLLRELVDRIRQGVPNYFGPQRFGIRGTSQWIGRALLLGDDRTAVRRLLGDPCTSENHPGVVAARHRFLQYRWAEALDSFPATYRTERRMLARLLRVGEDYVSARREFRGEVLRIYLSAYQGWIFNEVLVERLAASERDLSRFFPGDVAFLHRNGALFAVVDPAELVERARAFEVSPSGPLFGAETLEAAGVERELEDRVLAREGVVPADFHRLASWCNLSGARRAFRVVPEDLEWRFLEGSDVEFRFFLAKGAYATTVLREVLKSDHPAPGYARR